MLRCTWTRKRRRGQRSHGAACEGRLAPAAAVAGDTSVPAGWRLAGEDGVTIPTLRSSAAAKNGRRAYVGFDSKERSARVAVIPRLLTRRRNRPFRANLMEQNKCRP